MKSILRAFTAAATLLLFVGSAHAQQWTPFPQLRSGSRIAVDPSLDARNDWSVAEDCLAGLESSVGATYYAAVVPVTDRNGIASPSANDAVPYVDALYDAWVTRHPIDPERHNLIVMGLENRAVAIHPGTEFVGWGFEKLAITNTIDGSAFKVHARSGDYPRAICSLAEATDARLARMRLEAERRGEDARKLVHRLRDEFNDVPDLVSRARKLDPELGEWVEGRTVTAQDRVQAAKSALDDRPFQAWEYAETARKSLAAARNGVDDYESFVGEIDDWKQSLDTMKRRVENRPDSEWHYPQLALREIDYCRSLIDQTRRELTTGSGSPRKVDQCVANVERYMRDADDSYSFATVTVPAIVGGALLLVFLVLFIVAIVRRSRMLKLVEAETARWEDALGTASERLLDLEREFSMYFDSGRPAWTGASAELDQECADEVNRVFLMFSKAKDIHDEALAMLDDANPIRTRPLEKILDHLQSANVTLETGEHETRRRIFLPLTREYQADAGKLLSDLSGSYERAARLLEEATSLMERVDELRRTLSTVSSDLSEAIASRADAGFPMDHLDTSRDEGEAARADGNALADTDPRTAIDHLEKALDVLEETLHVATVGNAVLHHVREEAPGYRARLRARIETMRENGWQVREPGFDPDQRLEKAVRVGQRAIELVAAAKEEDANVAWTRLEHDLEQLDEQLTATKDARDGVPKTLQTYRSRFEDLEARLPRARDVLAELEAEHARRAFEEESDNLAEYEKLRDGLRTGFDSVNTAHAAQRYLAALSDLETIDHGLQLMKGLLDALVGKLDELERARKHARTQIERAEKNLDAIDRARKGRLGVDPELQAEITEVNEAAADARAMIEEERPHWREADQRATRTASLSQQLLDEVHAELEKHVEAVRLHANLRTRIADLQRKVQEEKRDRPHVGALVSDAAEALERTRTRLDEENVGGEELFVAVDEVRKWYDRAEQAWKSELQAIFAAEAEIAAAQQRYDQVDGTSYGYSVYATCSDAEEDLRAAREAAATRDWDAAVTAAARAKRKIEAEDQRATFAADRKRRAAQRASRSTSSSSSFSSSSFSSSSSSSSSFSSSSFSSSSSSFSGGSSYSSSSGGSSW